MSEVTLAAPAKINLTLEVLGRRGDGYHDLASIMVAVDLADEVTVGDSDELSIECDVPSLSGPDNLGLRAAGRLVEELGRAGGARVRIAKRIPEAAGLGGGSSDAAAVLIGLTRLWRTGMTARDLTPLAAELGSDVPFFLHGGTAMVQGRGEVVRPLPGAEVHHVLILSPDIRLERKTAAMFGLLAGSAPDRGALTRKLEARIRGGGDVPAQLLYNRFDAEAGRAYPGIAHYRETLASLGATEIHLCGAGPSMFTLVSRREVGSALQLLLERRHGWRARLASPAPPVAWPGGAG